AGTKIAAFGAILRFFHTAVPGLEADWGPVLWVVSALTMVVGTVVGVVQNDVKRLLAYSSVAHAGFLLTAVTVGEPAGVPAVLFYLAAYAASTVGVFAVAGLPLTSGFIAKFAVFSAAVTGGAPSLVVLGVLTSAIAASFYVRVIVVMFFHDSDRPAAGGGTGGPVVAFARRPLTLGVI